MPEPTTLPDRDDEGVAYTSDARGILEAAGVPKQRGRNREFYWYDSDDQRVADLLQRWHLSSRSEVLRRCLVLAHAGEVLTDEKDN